MLCEIRKINSFLLESLNSLDVHKNYENVMLLNFIILTLAILEMRVQHVVVHFSSISKLQMVIFDTQFKRCITKEVQNNIYLYFQN